MISRTKFKQKNLPYTLTSNKLKIFNDPIYGFISLPNELIFDLIQHPYFQRLRRISQMGLTSLVYPGATHSRFHHALGAMHLMQKAVQTLKFKNIQISVEEENALYVAILLHDIGHGPFSHALEKSIVSGIHHEELSLLFMEELNIEFTGKLDLAIQIFRGDYHRKFMLQLISSQLDMDRMDYLNRDSFYSGVVEGAISSDRLIQMLHVKNDILVLEEKGIYSIEKFLMARKLMYWQVYLHKTSVVAEITLTKILKRAKELTTKGNHLECSKSLQYFLNENQIQIFTTESLKTFAFLDDFDVVSALKNWQFSDDFVLSSLSKMILNRDLLKIKMSDEKLDTQLLANYKKNFAQINNISEVDAAYFVFKGKLKNLAYDKDNEPISILKKDEAIETIFETSEQIPLKALSKQIVKYYMCFPKVLLDV